MAYDKKQTDELIKEINSKLNYSLPLEKRMDVLEELGKDLIPRLNELNFYYSTNKSQYANNKIKEKIDHTLEKINEYILFCSGDDVPSKTEYTYKRQADLKDASANEINLENYMTSINKMKNLKSYGEYYPVLSKKKVNKRQSVVYISKDEFGKNVKVKEKIYSVVDLVKDMDRCPYLKDYDDYNKAARDIIGAYEEIVYNIEKKIKKHKKSIKKLNNSTEVQNKRDEMDKLKRELHDLKNSTYGWKIYYKDGLDSVQYEIIKNSIIYDLKDMYVVKYLPFNDYIKEMKYISCKDTGLVEKEIVYDKLILSSWIGILKQAIGYRKDNSTEIDKDKIAVYRQWAGLIYFRNPLKESNNPTRSWRDIDLFEKEDIRKCLNLLSIENLEDADRTGNMKLIRDKIENALEKVSLTDNERIVIDALRVKKGINKNDLFDFYSQVWSLEEISDRLKLSRRNVQHAIESTIRKLSNYFVCIYSDYYYLNIYKGKYKTCSKCNEQKPATLDWFSPKKDSKDGLHPYCKSCRS